MGDFVFLGFFFAFGLPILLMVVGFVAGSIIQQNHLRSMEEREARMQHIGLSNMDPKVAGGDFELHAYVDGQAVIGVDFFRSRTSRFRNLFGGEMQSLGKVMVRARREAMLRMLEKADSMGATQVWNVRVDTSTIANGNDERKTGQKKLMAEIHVYGTAIRPGSNDE